MSDLFATGVQIPDLETGQARPADYPGFIRIFSRGKQMFARDNLGTEYRLGGEQTVFFQTGDTPTEIPGAGSKYIVYLDTSDGLVPYIWET